MCLYTFDSDHYPLSFSIKAKFARPPNAPRKVYCYEKADLDGLGDTLQHIPWDCIQLADDLDGSVLCFQDMLFTAMNQHIPQTTLRRKSRPPWIDLDVLKLVKKKRALPRAIH